MFNNKCLIILISIFTANLFAQTQAWVRRYDGPANVVDGALAIGLDSESNVYITGRSGDTPSSFECTTIKYDSAGNQLWIRKYSGSATSGYCDTGWELAVDNAGNIYIGAAIRDSVTSDDLGTIKYNPDGDTLWTRRYNGPGDDYDWPFDIAVDAANNVYLTGRSVGAGTAHDYVTIKYDSDGNEKWAKRYDGPASGTDEAYNIAVDKSGNVYTTGTSLGSGTGLDFATIKYDPTGNELWTKRFHTTGEMDEYGARLAVDNNGYTYVTGGTWKFFQGIKTDIITIKYDANGDTVWTRRYTGPGNYDDIPAAIEIDNAGYIVITGETYRTSSGVDFFTIKYDANGDTVWTRRYNGPANQHDRAEAMYIDFNNNIYITGESRGSVDNDFATVVYGADGYEITVQRYDGPSTSWADSPYGIVADGYGNFYVTGFSGGVGTTYDILTIKYAGMPAVEEEIYPMKNKTFVATIINGPLRLPTGKKCKVYDISGRSVNPRSVKPGIYFIEVEGRISHKVVKTR